MITDDIKTSTLKCKHEQAYPFHHNSCLYCDDCEKYVGYQDINNDGVFVLTTLK